MNLFENILKILWIICLFLPNLSSDFIYKISPLRRIRFINWYSGLLKSLPLAFSINMYSSCIPRSLAVETCLSKDWSLLLTLA